MRLRRFSHPSKRGKANAALVAQGAPAGGCPAWENNSMGRTKN